MMTLDPGRSALPITLGTTHGTHGEVRFATTDGRDQASVRLGRPGMIVAEVEGVGRSAGGGWAELIAEPSGRELAVCGEASPGLLGARADHGRARSARSP